MYFFEVVFFTVDSIISIQAPKKDDNSKEKILKNVAYKSGPWVTIVFIGIKARPYFVHKLSIEGYGHYAFPTGLMGNYGMFDLGLEQG